MSSLLLLTKAGPELRKKRCMGSGGSRQSVSSCKPCGEGKSFAVNHFPEHKRGECIS